MKISCFLIILLFNSWVAFCQNTWQEFTETADSLQAVNQYENAFRNRQKAVELAKQKQLDTLSFLELLRDMSKSETLIFSSNKNQVTKAYESLLGQIKKIETVTTNPSRLIKIYNSASTVADRINKLSDSDELISKSIELHLNHKELDAVLRLRTLCKAGVTFMKVKKLTASKKAFEQAAVFYEESKINDAHTLGFVYKNLAELYRYRNLDDPKKNITYLKKAQIVFEEVNSVDDLIQVYIGMSDFMSNGGDFEKAISYLKKAFKLYEDDVKKFEKLGVDKRSVQKEIKFHNYFIEKYRNISDEKMMLYHLNEILTLAKPNVLNDYIEDLISLSYIYLVALCEDYDGEKALSYLDKGSKFFPTKDLYFIKEEYGMHYAKIYSDQKKYDKAQIILNKLKSKKSLPAFITKTTLEKSSIVNINTNEKQQAIRDIDTLLVRYFNNPTESITKITYKKFKPSTVLSDTQRFLNLANEFKKNDQYEIATKLFWLALKQFQTNFNKELLNDRIDLMYEDICSFFYTEASKGLLDIEKQKRFIKFTETIESKYLLNTFRNNRLESSNSELDSLITKERFIRTNITSLKKQNITVKSDSIAQQIFDEKLKLEVITEKLRLIDNNITSLISADFNFQKIEENYIVKFKSIGKDLFRIEFDKGIIKVKKIEDFKTLKETVTSVVDLLKNPSSEIDVIKDKTSLLFEKLFIDANILNQETLYIIPDDVLHYLPFELLRYHNTYLLELKTISYGSSISLIGDFSEEKITRKQEIALFAPSYRAFAPTDSQLAVRGEPYFLEGALTEVKSIANIFSNSKMFTNEKASKKVFQNLSNDYAIIHLSMHSYLNDQDAELSSLVFSDNEEDHELYISELYGLNLNADLAVLSACNTGVGKLKTGNGIVSMNAAFTAAGIPSILSSLWSAPDKATQKIMTTFYENLKKGETKVVALKNAKLEYLNTTDDTNLKHPYYWAGFTLTGDISAIISPVNYWPHIVVAIGLLSIFFLIIKRRLKSKS